MSFKHMYKVLPSPEFKFKKGIYICQKFGGDAIGEAKKCQNINLALINMQEPDQADLLKRLEDDRFIAGLSLLNNPLPVCQHTECSKVGLSTSSTVAIYLSGVRARPIEEIYLSFCDKHYILFEQKYLEKANWIKRFD